jgi:hypothetical protein
MTPAAERLARRAILSAAIGLVLACLAWQAQASIVLTTDFAQVWHAAAAAGGGRNPYAAVGPSGTFRWPFPLLYPGTAVTAAVPLTWLSLRAASAVFVGLGGAALAWGLSGSDRHPGRWFVFASANLAYVIRTAQWAPLLMGSALTPPLGWVLACKPTLGAALFAAYPTRMTAIGIGVFGAISIAWLPTWPRDWLAALPAAYHMTAPVTYLTAGGPLLLLALLRWRRPEARLVAVLGCIPHTTMLYEALPLFLVPQRWQEGLLLAALSWVCYALPESSDYLQRMHDTAWRMTLLLYLPCVAMILMRPNAGTFAAATTESLDR